MSSSPVLRAHGALRALLLTAALAGTSGCASPSEADHPHPQDFVLGEGYSYEKNPDVKLAREYWIVIRGDNGSYAMLPRPDGDPRIVEECAAKGPLASLFEDAALCSPASASTLDRVNALARSEAMQTSTFLHQKLRFVAKDGPPSGTGAVEPFPLTDDLIDVCKAHPDDRNGALRAVCDEELRYEEGGDRPAIARQYTIDESRLIASRLNELYGIR